MSLAEKSQPFYSRFVRLRRLFLLFLALPIFAQAACGSNGSPDRLSTTSELSARSLFWFSGTINDPYAMAGQSQTAQFASMRRYNVEYRVCLTGPAGKTACRSKTTVAAGTPSRVRFPLHLIGPHRLRWYVDDELVDGINFDVGIE